MVRVLEEHQGAGLDGLAGAQAQLPEDLVGREVVAEDLPQTRLSFEAEVVLLRREVPPGEVLHEPSLADLTDALENEGFAVGVVRPTDEILGGLAFHGVTWGEWVDGVLHHILRFRGLGPHQMS